MDVLNLADIPTVMQVLKERLQPWERAEELVLQAEAIPSGARRSAVLLALCVQQDTLSLLFIRRALSLRAHRGEMAFPGGKAEAEDHSLLATALREAHEEIGLDTSQCTVLGALPPVFTVVSNYVIAPFVAFFPAGLGMMQIQESEVAESVVLPLTELADPAIFHTEQWARDGIARTVFFYQCRSYSIWGATGHILTTLLRLLR